jgi:Xaa-Pro aminopeptidase
VTTVNAERRTRLLALLGQRKADGAAISHLPNLRYLTGFTGSNGLLLVTPRSATLFTDPRYDIQARAETDCAVRVLTGSLWPEVAKVVKKSRLKRLAVEDGKLSYATHRALQGMLAPVTRLVSAEGLTEGLRMLKSAGEIDAIRRAMNLAAKAYQSVIGRVRPGWTEQRVAAELDHKMRMLGAEGPAFETIVASGPRSALPHARPAAVEVGRNRLLLVDMGASLDGYTSDMTRVVHLNKPSRKARAVYDAVLEAQLTATEAVRPGAAASAVDAAARKSLRQRGLDGAFTHSTGHGLGLEIHENPRVGRNSETLLEPGMVITIEPGVYLEGFGGVRIEDTVLVTPGGCEVLTPLAKELQILT